MYDTTLAAVARIENRLTILETLGLLPKSYTVATIHQAENTDDRRQFIRLLAWLDEAARSRPWPELDLVIIGDGMRCGKAQLQNPSRGVDPSEKCLAPYITGATVGLVPLIRWAAAGVRRIPA